MNPNTAIKHFNILKYYILNLLSAFKFTLMCQLSFKSMKKLSATVLSQQSSLYLMAHTLNNMMLLYNSHMASWLPRSVYQISPLRGLRYQIAISKALFTSSACILLLIDQPTTFLEYKSITACIKQNYR